jgi:hypothetical protein
MKQPKPRYLWAAIAALSICLATSQALIFSLRRSLVLYENLHVPTPEAGPPESTPQLRSYVNFS